jgi:hypothetical protein
MAYAKQTCAYITHHSGLDKTRLRFIGLLIHHVYKFSDPDATFLCSACAGYSDYKFSEDTEIVKQLELQRFLETHFGISASVGTSVSTPAVRRADGVAVQAKSVQPDPMPESRDDHHHQQRPQNEEVNDDDDEEEAEEEEDPTRSSSSS